MSVYREIRTEFRNGESLVMALEDLGLKISRSADLHQNTEVLKTHWRRHGGVDHNVAIAVQKQDLAEKMLYALDGLGFAWNENTQSYTMIQDGLSKQFGDQIRQRYAYHEIERSVYDKGFFIREETTVSGVVNLVLARAR